MPVTVIVFSVISVAFVTMLPLSLCHLKVAPPSVLPGVCISTLYSWFSNLLYPAPGGNIQGSSIVTSGFVRACIVPIGGATNESQNEETVSQLIGKLSLDPE